VRVIDTPKRRGRPPGVKNKPKAPPQSETYVDISTTRHATPESWTAGPQGGIRVSVTFRVAMSSPRETDKREGFFPPGWPIPQLNDVVILGGLKGRVQWVEYDYDAGVVRINAN